MGIIHYGKITKVHGLAGEVKLVPFSRQTDALSTIEHVFIEMTPGGDPEKFKVTRCRLSKGSAIIKLEGIDSIDDAERLKGHKAYIEESELPELEEDEYYWFELVGLEVYTEDGRYLGRVESLIDRALQSLLVVRNDEKEILIPLSEPIVKEVKLGESRIIISPVGGLLDQD